MLAGESELRRQHQSCHDRRTAYFCLTHEYFVNALRLFFSTFLFVLCMEAEVLLAQIVDNRHYDVINLEGMPFDLACCCRRLRGALWLNRGWHQLRACGTPLARALPFDGQCLQITLKWRLPFQPLACNRGDSWKRRTCKSSIRLLFRATFSSGK